MWKPILAGTAALAIAGSSVVFAQQRDHDGAGAGKRHRGMNFSQEDRSAFTDARIAALKAGLRLTPDQEKNWPAFETALRDISKARMERRAAMQERRDARSDDPVERLRRQAEMLSTAGASLKRLADAQEPLYQSLDDGQKNRFKLLSRTLAGPRQHFAQMRRHHMMMHGPRGDHGMPGQGPGGDHGMPGQGPGGNL